MRMFLKSKEIAYVGIVMAIAVVLVTLGGYFEVSTLFFLAAAAFLGGCVEKNTNLMASVAFLIGSTLLGFILAPQKFYIATFFGFCVYVIVAEYFEIKMQKQDKKSPMVFVWIIKCVLYHVMLVAALFLMQKLMGFDMLFSAGIFKWIKGNNILIAVVGVIGAEGLWIVFDRAYIYFQRRYGHFLTMRE